VAASPLVFTYALVGGLLGGIALVLSGAAIIGTFGVSLVMSQEYMPSRVGVASGLSIGFAIGLGGVAAVLLGAVADAIDLEAAIIACAVGPALAAVLTLALPPSRRTARIEPAAAPI
jgi:FSR family fosmidomycin resistance protein-like MFS transporter